jgi:hypothetical protein
MERTPVTNRVKVPHKPYSHEELRARREAQDEQRNMLSTRVKVGFAIGVIAAVGAVESLKGVVGALDHQAENTPHATRLADTQPIPSPDAQPAQHPDK